MIVVDGETDTRYYSVKIVERNMKKMKIGDCPYLSTINFEFEIL